MLPDDQRIFNYRLSCARRVVENALGIMANIWMFAHHYESKQRHCHFNCIGLLSTAQYHETIRYPGVHYGIGDDEDKYHRLVPGQWRQGVNL